MGGEQCPQGTLQTMVGQCRPPTHEKGKQLLFMCTVRGDDRKSERNHSMVNRSLRMQYCVSYVVEGMAREKLKI